MSSPNTCERMCLDFRYNLALLLKAGTQYPYFNEKRDKQENIPASGGI